MTNIFLSLGCQMLGQHMRGHNGCTYTLEDGVWCAPQQLSHSQEQTSTTFAYKWHQQDTFDSPQSLAKARQWLLSRYGDAKEYIRQCPKSHDGKIIMVDVGCGAAWSSLEYFAEYLDQMHYVGVDVSDAVKMAVQRMNARGRAGLFVRESLMDMPFAPESADMAFSEGVLHHTDSTRKALHKMAVLLKPGGYALFYVYKKKGPIREFTDDFLREKLQPLSPEEAWEALKPLTALGIELGKHDFELHIPQDIPLLDIPAGKISMQRFIYWHIFKAFYREESSFDELNHINFDWYTPKNAHRQSPEEVQAWCKEENLDIVRLQIEEAGITVVARKGV